MQWRQFRWGAREANAPPPQFLAERLYITSKLLKMQHLGSASEKFCPEHGPPPSNMAVPPPPTFQTKLMPLSWRTSRLFVVFGHQEGDKVSALSEQKHNRNHFYELF